MPVFALQDELVFPPVELANEDGILAVGGDLSPNRLLLAYSSGIFPWYNEDEPIIWWAPNPRFVIFPRDLRVSKSLRKLIKRGAFEVTFDRAFREVMSGCRSPRKNQDGTWITDEMLEAYCLLHELGFAHSVEAWQDGELAGGLYGVSLGRCFFGESMFTRVSNASKVAFATLAERLLSHDFQLIDSQVYTDHLSTFGAINIPRDEYQIHLDRILQYETLRGDWGELLK